MPHRSRDRIMSRPALDLRLKSIRGAPLPGELQIRVVI